MFDLIKQLTEAWAPSGYEHHLRATLREMVKPYADEVSVDGLGNLIVRVGKGGKKVLIAAHMDEIGVMANYAEPKTGYLRFAPIGGLLYTTLHGSRVMFEDGTIGVMANQDPWGKGRTAASDTDTFYIDTEDETGAQRVRVGSPAVFWRETQQRGSRVIGKAMDDRIGCVVALETLKRLAGKADHELYFVFTVQEEVGLRGARVAAQGIKPDLAIALDVTAAGDEIKAERLAVRLGEGAAIKVMDIGHVVPPDLLHWMIDTAEKHGIPYQSEVLARGTTDAAALQLAHSGVPTGCISIPTRFVHTTSETVDLADVNACIDLLTQLVRSPLKLKKKAKI